MTDYVLGQVAAGLTQSKPKEKENKKLAALFTVTAKPPEPEKENVIKPENVKLKEIEKKPVKKKRHIEEVKEIKKKRKRNEEKVKEKETEEPESIKTLGQEEEETEKPVHWSKLSGAARRVASKETRKHDTSKDHRTIFIGNLPLSLAHKVKLKKLFSKYGAIESLRFRCPPTKDLTTSKRVAVIKKEFHPDRDNMIAYVCYKEEFSAEKALYMNGKEIDGHHLRVDISTSKPKVNHNKSIFIGNLPFDVREDDVREIFTVCGDIDNVRIVRDNKTGLGKGFCYVSFKKKEHVELALKLDGSQLKKREVRVKRCLRDAKSVLQKDQENQWQSESTRPFRPKKKFNQPSNSVKHSFQGMKAKRSLKDKMKKRKIPRMNSSNSAKQRHPKNDSKDFKSSKDFKGSKDFKSSKDFKNSKPKQFGAGNKAHKRFN